jgi:hypothetical protein
MLETQRDRKKKFGEVFTPMSFINDMLGDLEAYYKEKYNKNIFEDETLKWGDGLTHIKLKENISKVLREIPKEKYTNIFKGAYNRDTIYVKKTSRMTRKLKNYKV